MNVLGNVLQAVFDSEVPGLQSMHLCLRQCLQISFAALPRKKDVILSPKDDRFRPLLSEERLPLRVQRHISAVVVEEVQLDLAAVWLLNRRKKICIPVVWTDQFWLG